MTRKTEKKLLLLAVALLLLLGSLALTLIREDREPVPTAAPTAGESGGVDLTFLDVGQGDSTLLRWQDHAVLIDAGEADQGEQVAARLVNLGVRKLDLIVATHAHSDHIGGIARLLEVFPVEEFYWSAAPGEGRLYENLAGALADREMTPVSPAPGDLWSKDGVTLRFLGPVREYSDLNNSSLVFRVEAAGVQVLMTGDLEAEGELDLVESGRDLSARILKVGHHGSSSSSTEEFLKAVDPELAVISCGKENEYGHPHRETLAALAVQGARVARTDLEGELDFRLEDGNVTQVSAPAEEARYIGNSKSRKFHDPGCSGLPAEQNRVEFWERENALWMGYAPCGICNP